MTIQDELSSYFLGWYFREAGVVGDHLSCGIYDLLIAGFTLGRDVATAHGVPPLCWFLGILPRRYPLEAHLSHAFRQQGVEPYLEGFGLHTLITVEGQT